MDLNARVDINCGQKDGWTDGLTGGRKTRCLYRTLLRRVRQKYLYQKFILFYHFGIEFTSLCLYQANGGFLKNLKVKQGTGQY